MSSTSSAAATAAAAASSYAATLGVVQPLPSMRTQLGPYRFRADFDSANMQRVEYTGSHPLESTFSADHLSTPDSFDCWLSSDPMSTYRVWFHVAVAGGRRGKQIRLRLCNFNNKKPLIGEGMLPLVRSTASPQWKRVQGVEFETIQTTEGGARSFLPAADGGGGEDEEEGGNAEESAEAEEEEEGVASSRTAATVSKPSPPSSAAPRKTDAAGAVKRRVASAAGSKGASAAASSAAAAASSSAATPAASGSRPRTAGSKGASAPLKKKHDTMLLTLLHTFDCDNDSGETFFAFCLPYSYTQLQTQLLAYEQRFNAASCAPRDRDIYLHREILAHSLEGRRVDLLTISSHRDRMGQFEPDAPGLYPIPTADSCRGADAARMFAPATPVAPCNVTEAAPTAAVPPAASVPAAASASLCSPEPRACCFSPSSSKLLILLSARVHPGETPSSFMLAGALDFLLDSSDPRARALRDRAVVKVVPCLNPDGVVHGFYRTDSLGHNLNRFYDQPAPHLHPSIFAVRQLVSQWHARRAGSLWAYIDLHAHAMKRGMFVFGNHMGSEDMEAHVRNVSYARLVALNSAYLSLRNCDFSAAGMRARDKRDGLSKEGAGRVAFYKLTKCAHAYTVEVNYHNGRSVNQVAPLPAEASTVASSSEGDQTVAASAAPAAASSSSPSSSVSWQRDDHLHSQSSQVGPPVQYAETHFRQMGKALMVSLLDLMPPNADGSPANPYSRLPSSELEDRAGLERWARQYIMAPPKRLAKKLSKGNSATAKARTSASVAASAPPTALRG